MHLMWEMKEFVTQSDSSFNWTRDATLVWRCLSSVTFVPFASILLLAVLSISGPVY